MLGVCQGQEVPQKLYPSLPSDAFLQAFQENGVPASASEPSARMIVSTRPAPLAPQRRNAELAPRANSVGPGLARYPLHVPTLAPKPVAHSRSVAGPTPTRPFVQPVSNPQPILAPPPVPQRETPTSQQPPLAPPPTLQPVPLRGKSAPAVATAPVELGIGHRAANRALQAIAASLETSRSVTSSHTMRRPTAPGSEGPQDAWPLGVSPFELSGAANQRGWQDHHLSVSRSRWLNPAGDPTATDAQPASFRSVLKKQDFRLADQPQPGEHFLSDAPTVDGRGLLMPYCESDFAADPIDPWLPYDGDSQINVYSGKTLNANQRPLIEWGRPYYFLGQFPESYTFLGDTNLVAPRFVVYGDYRTALATNNQNGNTQSVWAQRLNLDMDLKLTATERFHAFMGPLDHNNKFTRGVFDNGQYDYFPAVDGQLDTAFFEGDLGAIAGGLGNEVLPFDLPIAIGLMPLLFQNGIWMEDAILGAAATIPARNSPVFDLSNFDVTFFAGIDKLNSPAFAGDDAAARLYGTTTFIEAFDGYLEAGYAYLEDRTLLDRSYHNLGISYTRRYRSIVSTSYRAIINMGQNPVGIDETADGVLLLWENSLITSSPYTCVPYFNFFVGFGRPQSVARAGGAGGVLRNTGINFETDGLTGYPTLDASGNDTFGGAIGMNLLSSNFDQQLIAEFAFLNTMGSDPNRVAPGDQYGLGVRYQLPLTNALIFRCDAMVGLLNNANDISGFRCEFRHKF